MFDVAIYSENVFRSPLPCGDDADLNQKSQIRKDAALQLQVKWLNSNSPHQQKGVDHIMLQCKLKKLLSRFSSLKNGTIIPTVFIHSSPAGQYVAQSRIPDNCFYSTYQHVGIQSNRENLDGASQDFQMNATTVLLNFDESTS